MDSSGPPTSICNINGIFVDVEKIAEVIPGYCQGICKGGFQVLFSIKFEVVKVGHAMTIFELSLRHDYNISSLAFLPCF